MSKLFDVKLNISSAQLRKLHNGHKVQLNHSDLGSGQSFNVVKKVNTKIQRAMRQGKGMRIGMEDLNLQDQGEEMMEGGDLLKKIGIKKKVIKYGNKYGLPIARVVAQTALPVASKSLGDAVTGYTGSPLAGEIAKNVSNQLGKQLIDEIPKGGALKKRFVKGSPEAKAFMANLRARKNGGMSMMQEGGSFKPNGGSFRAHGRVNGGSFKPNGGSIRNDLMDGHYEVLPNSDSFNGMVSKNGNPILKTMKSTQSLYNDMPRLKPITKGGKLSLIV